MCLIAKYSPPTGEDVEIFWASYMHCMMGKLQSLGGLKHVFCSVLAKNANFGTRLCTDQKQTASLGYCKMQSTSWRSCRSILSIRHALCGKKIRLYEALKYVFWAVWTKKAKFSTSLRTDKRQTAGVSHCQIQSTYWGSCGNILSIIHALYGSKTRTCLCTAVWMQNLQINH